MNTTELKQGDAAVAIIGWGTAGVNAAIALRRAGYSGPIRAFTDGDARPYSPILTSYYAGGAKAFEECFPWSDEELAELEVELHAGCPVTALDVAAHTVDTPEGSYHYTKCVIATGATPMPYGFPGVEGDPAYRPLMLRTMDDAERLKTTLEDPKCQRILVSGASMVALKTVEACLDQGLDTTIVGLNPHVLDFNALPEAAIRFEKGLGEKGVTLKLGNPIAAVRRVEDADAYQGRCLEVTFKDGSTELYDEISVNHGMRCNLGFVQKGTIEVDRAIVVDEFMRSSDPDVYAAGDVAQALELISGQRRIVGIWKNAALQGACAGAAIARELAGEQPRLEEAFGGSIATNTIQVNGTLFISAGTMELGENRWTEVREDEKMTVVYVFEKTADGRRLVGFNITCDEDVEGDIAYDTGAMLTMQIERACR